MRILTVAMLVVFSLQLFARELTLERWLQLSSDQKLEAVFDDQLDAEEIYVLEKLNPKILSQLEIIKKDALTHLSSDEVDNDISSIENIVAIGDPSLSSVTYHLLGNQIVVFQLSFYQAGGESNGENSKSYYGSNEEAEADGVDTNADVCWSGSVYYLWEENSWKPLSYADYEGRGLSWCGW